jgi:hypothetical protein
MTVSPEPFFRLDDPIYQVIAFKTRSSLSHRTDRIRQVAVKGQVFAATD